MNEENQGEDRSKDEESDELPPTTEREFQKMSKKMRNLGKIIVDEMNDYKMSINLLHDENKKNCSTTCNCSPKARNSSIAARAPQPIRQPLDGSLS